MCLVVPAKWVSGYGSLLDVIDDKTLNPCHLPFPLFPLNRENGDTEVIFSDNCLTKLNPKLKGQQRGLAVTDCHIYKLHPKSCKPRKVPIPLEAVLEVWISPVRLAG